jgi:hypothetical protein
MGGKARYNSKAKTKIASFGTHGTVPVLKGTQD